MESLTVAQAKLFAIRARVNGVWDHPALDHFGPFAATGNLANDILAILNGGISQEALQAIAARTFADDAEEGQPNG